MTGVKIPPSLLEPDYCEQAPVFASELADGGSHRGQAPAGAARSIQ